MSTLKTFKSGKDSEIVNNPDAIFNALRAIWELLQYYIWYPTMDTARGIKDQNLTTDKITGAIHKRHLQPEVRSAIKTQLDYWQESHVIDSYEFTDNVIRWGFNKIITEKGDTLKFNKPIPVEFKILTRRYNFFEHPDPVTYNYDDYKLANPFEKYWKARFIVQ